MNEPDQHQPTNTPKREDLPRLYSLNGIGFATFFGSMLAGFFLLAANYHALGLKDQLRSRSVPVSRCFALILLSS